MRGAMAGPPQEAEMAAPPPAAVLDLAAELQQLAALKEQGILTEQEFEAKKKQILGI
jgi:predicted Zn-dependent peptidase